MILFMPGLTTDWSEWLHYGPGGDPANRTLRTEGSGTRPTFGPIAGPVNIPPLFGPIAGPVRMEDTRPTQRRQRMPFDIGPNLAGLAGSVIGGLFGGRRQQQGFMPGSPQVILPPVEVLRQAPPIRTPQLMSGRVTQRGCDCLIEKNMPAYVRRTKGKAVYGPNGEWLGCTPKARRLNPMNARAATRAASRLMNVSRFQKRIQKAIRRACISRGKTVGFSRKKTCK